MERFSVCALLISTEEVALHVSLATLGILEREGVAKIGGLEGQGCGGGADASSDGAVGGGWTWAAWPAAEDGGGGSVAVVRVWVIEGLESGERSEGL